MNWLNGAFEALKKIFEKHDRRKVIENAAIVIIIGIIAMIAGGSLFTKGVTKESAKDVNSARTESRSDAAAGKNSEESESDTVNRIVELLSQIEGAGKVSVMITYFSSREIVPAFDSKITENETQEKDSGGGVRNIKQVGRENTIVYQDSQGSGKEPVVLKEILPAVKGVVIVADGASDPVVRENLSKAAQILLDVPAHKVQVFERRK